MVQEYVTGLYQGAADSTRRLVDGDMEGARQLAAWKQRVRRSWPDVRIEHVEVAGEDPPQIGSEVAVRATLALGGLTPGDVEVEAAIGGVTPSDELVEPVFVALEAAEPDGAGADAKDTGPLVRYGGSRPRQ